MTSLFESNAPRPLADRLRPSKLSQVVGQDHILGPDAPIWRCRSGQGAKLMLRRILLAGVLFSILTVSAARAAAPEEEGPATMEEVLRVPRRRG